jgi:hypothetical protein
MHTPTSTAVATSLAKKEAETTTLPSTPTVPFDAAKAVEALPTPTSASDGRSQAARLLKERIKTMQEDDSQFGGSVGENLFPPSPARKDTTCASDESRIVDFSGDADSTCNSYNEHQLRNEKNEAQATMALLQAELLATRGRHEEEKREWMRSMDELRRRNDELESRLSLYSLEGGKKTNNARSASCPRVAGDGANDNQGAFGSRMRSFAQRFGSAPLHRGTSQQQQKQDLEPNEGAERRPSATSTIATNQIHEGLEISHSNENEQQLFNQILQDNIATLEKKLQQSEHRAKILEQRLQIVKESGDAVIRSLNEELSDVAEDRARSESAMIKELAALDSQRRKEKEEYEKQIQKWITMDENREAEVKEYERRIKSLLHVVKTMDAGNQGNENCLALVPVGTSSFDAEAEQEMYKDLTEYLELLSNRRTIVRAVNESLDMEFNASPTVADEMIEYYRSRPELMEFTLKSELPRMDYEVLVTDDENGEDIKLKTTDDIRAYFSSLKGNKQGIDEEVDIILRAANQSLLADPLAMLTGEGDGKLVHSGSFHSTLIATDCSFKLDLRIKGERRVKINCELAICVPSGTDGVGRTSARSSEDNDNLEDEKAEQSATLELARANLAIQFSPSPTSTPHGPLVKYTLLDVKPTITEYEEGSDDAQALHMAAAVLARDRYSNIRATETRSSEDNGPTVARRFLSRFSTMSIRSGDPQGE